MWFLCDIDNIQGTAAEEVRRPSVLVNSVFTPLEWIPTMAIGGPQDRTLEGVDIDAEIEGTMEVGGTSRCYAQLTARI